MATDRERICRLAELAARTARAHASTLLYGPARASVKGLGIEYMDFRDYEYGDDIKHVDWRISARMVLPTGDPRLIVKEYEAERSVNALVAVDLSASMGFGEKVWIATYAASLVAYTAAKLEDLVTLALLRNRRAEVYWELDPRSLPGRLRSTLCRESVSGEANLATLLGTLRRLRPRSPLILVMDYDHRPPEIDAVARFARSNQLTLQAILVADPNEVNPPLSGALAELRDPETGVAVVATLDEIYAGIRSHVRGLRARLRAGRAGYLELVGRRQAVMWRARIVSSYLRARAGMVIRYP